MRPDQRSRLMWGVVGAILYLIGLLGAILVIITAWLAEPSGSFETMGAADLMLVLVFLVITVAGRAITWKRGGGGHGMTGLSMFGTESVQTSISPSRNGPDQSPLEDMGYHIPPEAKGEDSPSRVAREGGELRIVCPQCGAKNEPGFSYCAECSGSLPTDIGG